jgi:hypothetical protein
MAFRLRPSSLERRLPALTGCSPVRSSLLEAGPRVLMLSNARPSLFAGPVATGLFCLSAAIKRGDEGTR